ncbi:MAG: tetratricopeptide repeat protein [Armatimonadia bacterium]|nr:tetratricopeptide repeat protein [Armatimonadia bacterium]
MTVPRWTWGLVAAMVLAFGLGAAIAWGWPLLEERKNEDRARALLDAANEALAAGDHQAALGTIGDSVALRRSPAAQAGLRRIASAALGPEDDPALAARACELLVELAPEDADARFGWALALARMGRHRDAAGRFAEAAALREPWPQADANRGLCLLAAGDPEAAIEPLEAATRSRAVRHPELLTALGQARLRALPADLNGAQDAFERALGVDPTMGAALAGLGVVKYHRGDLDGALADLDEAELLSPLEPDVLATRGALLCRAGDDQAAEAALHRALAIDPGHATARYDLGCIYLRRREAMLAEVQFRVACQSRPDDPLMRLGWAMALRLEGRDEEASSQLSRALALSPPGGAARLARAEILALSRDESATMLPPGSLSPAPGAPGSSAP